MPTSTEAKIRLTADELESLEEDGYDSDGELAPGVPDDERDQFDDEEVVEELLLQSSQVILSVTVATTNDQLKDQSESVAHAATNTDSDNGKGTGTCTNDIEVMRVQLMSVAELKYELKRVGKRGYSNKTKEKLVQLLKTYTESNGTASIDCTFGIRVEPPTSTNS